MRPGLRIWSLGACALAQASSSHDDPSVVYIVASDAGAGAVTPASDAATADASAANCNGQDALTQLLCQFGLQGAGQDAGAGAGQANIQDILNSFGGLAGIFGAGTGAGPGAAPASRDAGRLGGLFGGGAGGPFGAGATQPSATDCANATDTLTRLLCGFGRRDAGLGMPPGPTDSGALLDDAGAPLDDAGAENAPDASSDAGDADAGEAAVASP